MIAFPELMLFQEECAKKAGVKCQFYNSPGGTDAGIIHKSNDGILTLTHCIVARSIHTNSSIIDIDDYLAAKKSLLYMISNLKPEMIDKFKGTRR
jgi:putative aminopeptidase FrvX